MTPLRSMTLFDEPPVTFRDVTEFAEIVEPPLVSNVAPFNVMLPAEFVPKSIVSAPSLTTLSAPALNSDVMLGTQRPSSSSTIVG